MLLEVDRIIIGDRIRKEMGDIQELAADIKRNSLLNPITVMPVEDGRYRLIAGERRLRACKFLGKKNIVVNTVSVDDARQALLMEISENEVRKGFTFSERIEWARRLEEVEKVKAQERMKNPSQNSDEGGRTDDRVADEVGFGSRDTYRKAKFIAENAGPELIKQLDEDQISIHAAYKRLKTQNEKLEKEKAELEKRVQELKGQEPKVIEKEIVPANYKNMRKKYHEMELELADKEAQVKSLGKALGSLEKDKKMLEKKARLNEQEAREYSELKKQIKQLKLKKNDLAREFESATSLARYVVKIENFLQEQLAPIRYSRALAEQSHDRVVIENVTEIIGRVRDWCDEVERLLSGKNYTDIEVINNEQPV